MGFTFSVGEVGVALTIFIILMMLVTSLSLWLTLFLGKKFNLVSLKNIRYSKVLITCLKVFGFSFATFLLILLFLELGFFKKAILSYLIFLLLLLIIALQLPYFIFLIKKGFKLKWLESIIIYAITQLLVILFSILFFLFTRIID